MKSKILLALGMLSWATLTSACSAPPNCPTCGTTRNGTIVAINTMEVPQSSPFGKPFSVWDLVHHVVHSPTNRRLYVTDRSHAAIAIFDTVSDQPIGQVKAPAPGFVGSVCCEPDRISNFNEVSGPNGVVVTPPTTPGGKLGNLWVSDGDSTLKVFNLDTDGQSLWRHARRRAVVRPGAQHPDRHQRRLPHRRVRDDGRHDQPGLPGQLLRPGPVLLRRERGHLDFGL